MAWTDRGIIPLHKNFRCSIYKVHAIQILLVYSLDFIPHCLVVQLVHLVLGGLRGLHHPEKIKVTLLNGLNLSALLSLSLLLTPSPP